MYRAPEMIDLYNNYPIDQRTDIWVSCITLLLSISCVVAVWLPYMFVLQNPQIMGTIVPDDKPRKISGA